MKWLTPIFFLLFNGCANLAFQEQTNCVDLLICPEGPKIVPSSAHQLLNLPSPNNQAVVAVYSFPDLTGARKSKDNIASFSTAVTQGGLAILTEALRDAGRGTWFVVVERDGLDNLSRERQLIVNTRKTYDGEEGNMLKPLLYAGMILEGGIVAYDSNIRTGGTGARALGVGAKNQYREDIVTVSLRAILVQTGEVLLNVTTTKTILSTGTGSDLFRFYEMGTELIEMESGFTKNEAASYAVRSSIEAAVYGLVMAGLEKQLWDFNYDTLTPEDDDEVVKKDTN
jgi:curli production assembly/transport component CsgG